jgi:hypothetical protein
MHVLITPCIAYISLTSPAPIPPWAHVKLPYPKPLPMQKVIEMNRENPNLEIPAFPLLLQS